MKFDVKIYNNGDEIQSFTQHPVIIRNVDADDVTSISETCLNYGLPYAVTPHVESDASADK